MRRRLSNVTLVVTFCLAASNVTFAQLKDNIELNIFGAGNWYSSNRYEISFPQSVTPIQGEFKLDRGLRAGVRLGVFTRGHWGQEFFYSYEPNKTHFIRFTAPSSSLDLDIQVHNYGVTGLYYFHEGEERGIRPFASFGLGGTIYRLTPEAASLVRDPLRGNAQDMDNAHEIAFNYGFGFKTTRAAGPVGFRLDVRGFVGRTPSFGLARQSEDPTATVFPATGAFHNAEASAGIIFYFGRR
jgi:hypothetical protein